MDRASSLLVVEDQPNLAETLRRLGDELANEVRVARTLADAKRLIAEQPPDAVLLDVALPDGTGLDLMETLRGLPAWPHVIVLSGSARPEEAFELAQAGVRAYLNKPLNEATLLEVWRRTRSTPPDLTPALRASVGKVPLQTLEGTVRDVLVDEALAQARGSRRGAARLLDISRQFLQHVLRRRR